MQATGTPILKDDHYVLYPFADERDFEYLWSLVPKYKYNTLDGIYLEATKYCVKEYGKHFWGCANHKGERGAVIYLSYYPQWEWWTLDAYKDDAYAKECGELRASYDCARLVMDYFFRQYRAPLHTIHDIRSRAANILCRRLGFKDTGRMYTDIGEFIVLRKDHYGT